MTWTIRLLVFYLTVIGLYQGQLVTIRLNALELVSRGGDSVVHYVGLLLVSSIILTLLACAGLALILLRHRFAALAVSVLLGSMTVLYLAAALYMLLIWQRFGFSMVEDGATVLLCLSQWTFWELWGRRYFLSPPGTKPDRQG
ncbi:hypothetical protein ACRQ1B_25850 [Rhizobium panacihumi]|uniref:hypothetical protein n=1 Tax=Rhizobium panacihumi TaxID=2008450 RepID=UPI003D7A6371